MFLKFGGLRMDFIKEFLDEGRSRIKSRFFASFAFAFFAINWREIFYLAFSETSAEDRIRYFDTHTDFGGYVLGPLILGAVIAAGLPFVNNFFHEIVSGQVSAVRSRDDERAHERLKRRNEWEAERTRALALMVDNAELADRAERIQDEDVREELKSKLEEGGKDKQFGSISTGPLRQAFVRAKALLDAKEANIAQAQVKLHDYQEARRHTLGGGRDDEQRRLSKEISDLRNEKAELELQIEDIRAELSRRK
ncbi:hypothetical protein [Celeribacter sp.]|uniref:hypothetical protein n=1 Tax=Celeribacter sp. TaxID=1890673 RepID=UPI003A8EC869